MQDRFAQGISSTCLDFRACNLPLETPAIAAMVSKPKKAVEAKATVRVRLIVALKTAIDATTHSVLLHCTRERFPDAAALERQQWQQTCHAVPAAAQIRTGQGTFNTSSIDVRGSWTSWTSTSESFKVSVGQPRKGIALILNQVSWMHLRISCACQGRLQTSWQPGAPCWHAHSTIISSTAWAKLST